METAMQGWHDAVQLILQILNKTPGKKGIIVARTLALILLYQFYPF
jgi:hypothetical protein